jgi:formamidopyrimidine-DNA glycosylase
VPELPEVEVTRRSFADDIAGAQVFAMRLGKPLRWPLGIAPEQLQGRRVQSVRRRGKYLLLDLNEGLLILHLGMSGSLRFSSTLPAAGPHDHMDLCTSQGVLRLHDPRRFGAVVYAPHEQAWQAQKLLGHLGVEPFSELFTPEMFFEGLQRTARPIKTTLLQGDLVVGVGNIYASEALFLAGIRPTVASQHISRPRAKRLHQVVKEVLEMALAKGGSTLKDFSSAQGINGHYQFEAWVYDREGQPCRVCTAPIRMIRQGQRSSFYCAVCQKR